MVTSPPSAPKSPLRGRRAEVATLSDLITRRSRIVTVTGAAGCGKTRLVLDLAEKHRDEFPRGMAVALMSAVSDPDDVPQAICRALGLVAPTDSTAVERLQHILRNRQMLLVLDNFEHVIEAAPVVAALSRHCRHVTFLISSRRPLRVVGEHVVHLRPLAVPGAEDDTIETTDSPAVQMFCDHADTVSAEFAATPSVLAAVAGICRRLDGLPLAIELAAARTGALSPDAILQQVTDGAGPLSLVADRTPAAVRHHDLRATLQWSYHLLHRPASATLFRRLSTFHGPYVIESADAICGDENDIFDAHNELVELHLVERGPAGTFSMLRTIKDFARELLDASGEQHTLASRHARFYVDLARRAGAGLESHREQQWCARIGTEHLEVVGALDWLRANGGTSEAVNAAGWLGPYWLNRGQFSDGSRLLQSSGEIAPHARGWAVRLALESGWGTLNQDDTPRVVGALRRVHEELSETATTVAWLRSCEHLSYALRSFGQPQRAQHVVDRSLTACTTSANDWWVAEFLHRAALLAQQCGDDADAAATAARCFRAATQGGNQRIAARAQQILAVIDTPDPDEMATQLEGVLATSSGLGDHRGTVTTMALLGAVTSHRPDASEAAHWFRRTMSEGRKLGYWHGTALGVAGITALAADTGEWTSAAKLHGGLAPHLDLLSCQMTPTMTAGYLASIELARTRLGSNAFDKARAAATHWTWDDLVQHGLDLCRVLNRAVGARPDTRSQRTSDHPPGPKLTPREVEVLSLITRGQTNKEIAAALTMSPRTVEHHSSHIYQKLGVRGRIEAINHARTHKLLDDVAER